MIGRNVLNSLLIMLLLAPVMASATAAAPDNAKSDCAQCHPFEVQTYQQSAMSRAAQTTSFKAQWQNAGHLDTCLDCHAPSNNQGVNCNDCHGESIHLNQATMDSNVCARCHDAALENTYRHYRRRPTALSEARCIDCHMRPSPLGVDHYFRGLDSPDLLAEAVTLRWLIPDTREPTIQLFIKNQTAHAIPGGTSGRALWLLIKSHRVDWRALQRFGWLQTEQKLWVDHSLPPGVNRLEFQIPTATLTREPPDLALWLQTVPGQLQLDSGSGFWLYREDLSP
tara:strand:+ start:527 stop:1372 length:846 start_codon:yes stop_codon:yes gene_type:complete